LMIGANPRKQQPLLNLRLRKAALKGAEIMAVNPIDYDFNYRLGEKITVSPAALVQQLAGILKAVQEQTGNKGGTGELLNNIHISENHQAIAKKLLAGEKSAILLGNLASAHPQYATIRYLSGHIAELTGSSFGYLGESVNEAGLWLAGAVPHRGPAATKINGAGLNAQAMLENSLSTYLLFNIEPDLDCWNGSQAVTALAGADTVIAFTPYKSAVLQQVADLLLPIAIYAENEGSYTNVEGTTQAFSACVAAQGEARPAWKILRVLANRLAVAGCEYEAVNQIQQEISAATTTVVPDNKADWKRPESISPVNGKYARISELPMNSLDSLVRRAEALQQTADIADGMIHINQSCVTRLGLVADSRVKVQQDQAALTLPYMVDSRVPDNTILIHAGHPDIVSLGAWFSDVTIEKV
jgi:NADH-quinone oxidoreductase subunit G